MTSVDQLTTFCDTSADPSTQFLAPISGIHYPSFYMIFSHIFIVYLQKSEIPIQSEVLAHPFVISDHLSNLKGYYVQYDQTLNSKQSILGAAVLKYPTKLNLLTDSYAYPRSMSFLSQLSALMSNINFYIQQTSLIQILKTEHLVQTRSWYIPIISDLYSTVNKGPLSVTTLHDSPLSHPSYQPSVFNSEPLTGPKKSTIRDLYLMQVIQAIKKVTIADFISTSHVQSVLSKLKNRSVLVMDVEGPEECPVLVSLLDTHGVLYLLHNSQYSTDPKLGVSINMAIKQLSILPSDIQKHLFLGFNHLSHILNSMVFLYQKPVIVVKGGTREIQILNRSNVNPDAYTIFDLSHFGFEPSMDYIYSSLALNASGKLSHYPLLDQLVFLAAYNGLINYVTTPTDQLINCKLAQLLPRTTITDQTIPVEKPKIFPTQSHVEVNIQDIVVDFAKYSFNKDRYLLICKRVVESTNPAIHNNWIGALLEFAQGTTFVYHYVDLGYNPIQDSKLSFKLVFDNYAIYSTNDTKKQAQHECAKQFFMIWQQQIPLMAIDFQHHAMLPQKTLDFALNFPKSFGIIARHERWAFDFQASTRIQGFFTHMCIDFLNGDCSRGITCTKVHLIDARKAFKQLVIQRSVKRQQHSDVSTQQILQEEHPELTKQHAAKFERAYKHCQDKLSEQQQIDTWNPKVQQPIPAQQNAEIALHPFTISERSQSSINKALSLFDTSKSRMQELTLAQQQQADAVEMLMHDNSPPPERELSIDSSFHDEIPPPRVCRDFQNGACTRQNCRFLHIPPKMQRDSKQYCYNFQHGTCLHGRYCRYLHEKDPYYVKRPLNSNKNSDKQYDEPTSLDQSSVGSNSNSLPKQQRQQPRGQPQTGKPTDSFPKQNRRQPRGQSQIDEPASPTLVHKSVVQEAPIAIFYNRDSPQFDEIILPILDVPFDIQILDSHLTYLALFGDNDCVLLTSMTAQLIAVIKYLPRLSQVRTRQNQLFVSEPIFDLILTIGNFIKQLSDLALYSSFRFKLDGDKLIPAWSSADSILIDPLFISVRASINHILQEYARELQTQAIVGVLKSHTNSQGMTLLQTTSILKYTYAVCSSLGYKPQFYKTFGVQSHVTLRLLVLNQQSLEQMLFFHGSPTNSKLWPETTIPDFYMLSSDTQTFYNKFTNEHNTQIQVIRTFCPRLTCIHLAVYLTYTSTLEDISLFSDSNFASIRPVNVIPAVFIQHQPTEISVVSPTLTTYYILWDQDSYSLKYHDQIWSKGPSYGEFLGSSLTVPPKKHQPSLAQVQLAQNNNCFRCAGQLKGYADPGLTYNLQNLYTIYSQITLIPTTYDQFIQQKQYSRGSFTSLRVHNFIHESQIQLTVPPNLQHMYQCHFLRFPDAPNFQLLTQITKPRIISQNLLNGFAYFATYSPLATVLNSFDVIDSNGSNIVYDLTLHLVRYVKYLDQDNGRLDSYILDIITSHAQQFPQLAIIVKIKQLPARHIALGPSLYFVIDDGNYVSSAPMDLNSSVLQSISKQTITAISNYYVNASSGKDSFITMLKDTASNPQSQDELQRVILSYTGNMLPSSILRSHALQQLAINEPQSIDLFDSNIKYVISLPYILRMLVICLYLVKYDLQWGSILSTSITSQNYSEGNKIEFSIVRLFLKITRSFLQLILQPCAYFLPDVAVAYRSMFIETLFIKNFEHQARLVGSIRTILQLPIRFVFNFSRQLALLCVFIIGVITLIVFQADVSDRALVKWIIDRYVFVLTFGVSPSVFLAGFRRSFIVILVFLLMYYLLTFYVSFDNPPGITGMQIENKSLLGYLYTQYRNLFQDLTWMITQNGLRIKEMWVGDRGDNACLGIQIDLRAWVESMGWDLSVRPGRIFFLIWCSTRADEVIHWFDIILYTIAFFIIRYLSKSTYRVLSYPFFYIYFAAKVAVIAVLITSMPQLAFSALYSIIIFLVLITPGMTQLPIFASTILTTVFVLMVLYFDLQFRGILLFYHYVAIAVVCTCSFVTNATFQLITRNVQLILNSPSQLIHRSMMYITGKMHYRPPSLENFQNALVSFYRSSKIKSYTIRMNGFFKSFRAYVSRELLRDNPVLYQPKSFTTQSNRGGFAPLLPSIAIMRQFSSDNQARPLFLRLFKLASQVFYTQIFQPYTLFHNEYAYIRHLNPSKRLEDSRGLLKIKSSKVTFRNIVSAFSKAGQRFYIKDRPRNISPNCKDLGLKRALQMYSYAFQQHLKHPPTQLCSNPFIQAFCPGLTQSQVESRLNQAYNSFVQPIIVTYDLSTYDGTIVYQLKEIMGELFCNVLEHFSSFIPQNYKVEMCKHFRARTWSYALSQRQGRYTKDFMNIDGDGTEKSGDLITTNSNTLIHIFTVWVLCYISDLEFGVQVFPSAVGDDDVTIMDQSSLIKYQQAFNAIYNFKHTGSRALSPLVATRLAVSSTIGEFLGCDIRVNCGQVRMFKKPVKVAGYGLITQSTQPMSQIKKDVIFSMQFYNQLESTQKLSKNILGGQFQFRPYDLIPDRPLTDSRFLTPFELGQLALIGMAPWGCNNIFPQNEPYVLPLVCLNRKLQFAFSVHPLLTVDSLYNPYSPMNSDIPVAQDNIQKLKQKKTLTLEERKERNSKRRQNRARVSGVSKFASEFELYMRDKGITDPMAIFKVLTDPTGIDGPVYDKVKKLDDQIEKRGGRKIAYQQLGYKVFNKFVDKNKIPQSQQMKALAALLGDDIMSVLGPWLGKAGLALANHVAPKLIDYVKSSRPYKTIVNKLREWSVIPLNDNHPLLSYPITPSFQNLEDKEYSEGRNTDHAQSSFSATGLNLLALCAAIYPKKYSSRFPFNTKPVALLNKTSQTTLTTNMAGNCALVIQPQNLFSSTRFGVIFNDTTYNPTTGGQTPVGTPVLGPYQPIASSVQNYTLVGFMVEFITVAPELTNSGFATMSANHAGITNGPVLTTLAGGYLVSSSQLLAQPYAVTGSLSAGKGNFCFTFIPPAVDGQVDHSPLTDPWTSINNDDSLQLIFVVQGAPASTEVFLVNYYPLISWNPVQTIVPLIESQVALPGIYTQYFCQQLMAYNKNICVMGNEELDRFCAQILCNPPTYDIQFELARKYEVLVTNSGGMGLLSALGTSAQSGQKAGSGEFSGIIQSKLPTVECDKEDVEFVVQSQQIQQDIKNTNMDIAQFLQQQMRFRSVDKAKIN